MNELEQAVSRLVNQVGHWTPARWTLADAAPRAHALAQTLADLAADAAGEPRHPMPRLANDLALVDQVRVATNDLLDTLPDGETLAQALAAVRAFRQLI